MDCIKSLLSNCWCCISTPKEPGRESLLLTKTSSSAHSALTATHQPGRVIPSSLTSMVSTPKPATLEPARTTPPSVPPIVVANPNEEDISTLPSLPTTAVPPSPANRNDGSASPINWEEVD